MPQVSAALLLYRQGPTGLEVLLVHPGGPFWARKDEGAWSIPKGLCDPHENPAEAARREFAEETGHTPRGTLLALGSFRQSSAKQVEAFALEGDFDPVSLRSNMFEMEWPPRSGRRKSFPEADRAEWFSLDLARRKLVKGQVQVLDALADRISGD